MIAPQTVSPFAREVTMRELLTAQLRGWIRLCRAGLVAPNDMNAATIAAALLDEHGGDVLATIVDTDFGDGPVSFLVAAYLGRVLREDVRGAS